MLYSRILFVKIVVKILHVFSLHNNALNLVV